MGKGKGKFFKKVISIKKGEKLFEVKCNDHLISMSAIVQIKKRIRLKTKILIKRK